tara:strand:- start:636 stop:1049 length:414 start_codon:yes stop_codon:yes gene_type:complete
MFQALLTNTVLPFAKKHWRELLVVVCISAVFVKNHIDYLRLEQAYSVSQESLKNQLDTLRGLHSEELQRRDEALKEYKDAITAIREDYEKGLAQLEQDNTTRREEIVTEIIEREQLTENKSELATKIEEQFGFEYVR